MKFYGEHFMKIDWGSPKEEVRGPTRQPEGCLARPPSWSRQAPSWASGGPPRCPPFAYINPLGWKPLNKSRFRVSPPSRGGNLQRRKSISGGQIPPGRSPPVRGDRR